jgi:hypothetical protein
MLQDRVEYLTFETGLSVVVDRLIFIGIHHLEKYRRTRILHDGDHIPVTVSDKASCSLA